MRYILLRLIRHFIPEWLARFLLRRRWIIRPGLESSDPITAAKRYIDVLVEHGCSLKGRRVLIFGYGGRFAVGIELLRQGAGYVVLCDHFPALDRERNLELLPEQEKYLVLKDGEVQPRLQFMSLMHGDIREEGIQSQIEKVDYVISTSVFEHLEDVDGITKSLASLTRKDGLHLHFIDLRDHYFKYPFEMLTFSEFIWKSFLNPTSNLNRFRVRDYQRVFGKHFKNVETRVLAHERNEFYKTRRRLRSEFISGDSSMDSATLIEVIAREPK